MESSHCMLYFSQSENETDMLSHSNMSLGDTELSLMWNNLNLKHEAEPSVTSICHLFIHELLASFDRWSSYLPKFSMKTTKNWFFLQSVLYSSFRKSSIVCKRRQQPRLESRSSRSRSRRMKTRGSLGAELKHTPPRASLLSETLSFSCVWAETHAPESVSFEWNSFVCVCVSTRHFFPAHPYFWSLL